MTQLAPTTPRMPTEEADAPAVDATATADAARPPPSPVLVRTVRQTPTKETDTTHPDAPTDTAPTIPKPSKYRLLSSANPNPTTAPCDPRIKLIAHLLFNRPPDRRPFHVRGAESGGSRRLQCRSRPPNRRRLLIQLNR